MKEVLEAALFISGRAMALDELCNLLETSNKGQVRLLLEELARDYEQRQTAIKIVCEDEHYKMDLNTDHLIKVKHFAPQMDMPRAIISTLSYIAYKQPVRQSHIVEHFGNRAYDYVKDLLRRGLIAAKPAGHTKMLTTTPKLYDYIGSTDASTIHQKIEEANKKEEERIAGKAPKKKIPKISKPLPKKDITFEELEKEAKIIVKQREETEAQKTPEERLEDTFKEIAAVQEEQKTDAP